MEVLRDSSGDDSMKVIENDECKMKEILKVRDLDISIQKMELELQAVRTETLNVQTKSREELMKKLLKIEPWETATIVKNTRRFLDLFPEPVENVTLNYDQMKSVEQIESPRNQDFEILVPTEAKEPPTDLPQISQSPEQTLHEIEVQAK